MNALPCLLGVLLLSFVSGARAAELDTLLPDGIPGYGDPFGVTDYRLRHRIDNSAGLAFGSLTISPSLDVNAGYDSAPNGMAPASAVMQTVPSMLVADQQIGLGAYAAWSAAQFPGNQTQNTSGYTFALGERAVLPRETVTAAAADSVTQESGFSLTPTPPGRPVRVHLSDIRLQDKLSLSQFNLTPDISVTDYKFDVLPDQNRVDVRETLTADYAPGGPGKIVLRVNAVQSRYSIDLFNSGSKEILAGVQVDAAGLWTIKILAGAAHRDARLGASITAPVLEAAADWIPDGLDRVRFSVAHEIDDPDEISATPYTLDEAQFSLRHAYLRNVELACSLKLSHAAYTGGDHAETALAANLSLQWVVNAAIAVNAAYSFNDRQANFLNAASEHALVIGLTWTP